MKFTHLLIAVVAARTLVAQPSISHPPGGYVNVNGVRLWYESEGHGEPVILISGGSGHFPFLEEPGATFAALRDFLRVSSRLLQ